jgi:hypothetical protein
MTTAQQFRALALSLPGAEEGAHMGHPDFRLDGRVFASLDADERIGVAMLTPAQQRKLAQSSPAFAPAKGAWGKRGCTTIALADAYGDAVRAALTMAWENAMAAGPAAVRKKAGTAAKKPVATSGARRKTASRAAKAPAKKKPVAKRASSAPSRAASKPAPRRRSGR